MQATEITSFLEMLLRENIKLEDKKYHQIINDEVTGNLFYDTDSVLLAQSYNDLKIACEYIVGELINDINKKFGKEIDDFKTEGFEALFKETNLHSSSVIGLSNNFIKLINWAGNTLKTLDQYTKEKFRQDLSDCLEVTFCQSQEILEEVLLNNKIFDIEQQQKALEILNNCDNFNQDELLKLNRLISEQIANKASEHLDNLSYQHFQKLQDQDFKIHRYDTMKTHPVFIHLF